MGSLASLLAELETTTVRVGKAGREVTLRAIAGADRIAVRRLLPPPVPPEGGERAKPADLARYEEARAEWYRKLQAAEVAIAAEGAPVDKAVAAGADLLRSLPVGVIARLHDALQVLDRGDAPSDSSEGVARLLDAEADAVEAGTAGWLTAAGKPPAEPKVVAAILRMLRDEVETRAGGGEQSLEARAEKNS